MFLGRAEAASQRMLLSLLFASLGRVGTAEMRNRSLKFGFEDLNYVASESNQIMGSPHISPRIH